jgi:hypothetical protein
MIYFVQNSVTQAIKIGHSMKAPRLAELQRRCSDKLVLLGCFHGGAEHKKWFFDDFAQFHLEGDWYKGEILGKVKELIAKNAGKEPEVSVVVTGDSAFNNQPLVIQTLNELHAKNPIGWVITGGNRPFDLAAYDWSIQNKQVGLYRYHPVKSHGKVGFFEVGPKMLKSRFEHKVLLAFVTSNPTPSTLKMIKAAEKRGIPVVQKLG